MSSGHAPHASPNARPRREADIERWGGRLLIAATAVQVLLFAGFLVSSLKLHPTWDMVDLMLEAQSPRSLLDKLETPHVGQRIVLPKLVIDASARFFGGGLGVVCGAAIASLLAAGWLLLRSGVAAVAGRGWKLVVGCAMGLLLFRTYTLLDWVDPTYVQQALVLFFFVASVKLAAGPGASRLRSAAALAAGVCATFSSGQGVLVWPALLWLAFRQDARGSRLAATGACAVATCALYFWHNAPGAMLATTAKGSLADRLLLTLHYLGQPWVKIDVLYPLGLATALATLVAVGWLALRASGLEPRARRDLAVPLCVAGFGVATAVLTGVTRVGAGTFSVARYAVFVAFTQAALVPLMVRLLPESARARAVPATLVLAALLLPDQILVGRQVRSDAAALDAAVEAFRAGRWSPEIRHRIHPDPERIRRLYDDAP